MVELKHAQILRGGATARHLGFETASCSFETNASDRTLDFRFSLASKGGGETDVLLEIGVKDLPLILEAVAADMPESAGVLSQYAALACRNLADRLAEVYRVRASDQESARDILDKLKLVEEFVAQKYQDAPSEADEREQEVQDRLNEVLRSIKRLAAR